jgi:hypothetical protein
MTIDSERRVKKRPYNRPTVTEVRLVADEVVLLGCKTTSIQGPSQTNGSCIPVNAYGQPGNPCSTTSS